MKHLRRFNNYDDFAKESLQGRVKRPYVAWIENHGIEYGDKYEPKPEADVPIYVEAIKNLTVKLQYTTGPLQYSFDNETWIDAEAGSSQSVTAGSRVYFRATNTPTSSSGCGQFSISNDSNVGGNAMSLLFGADFGSADTVPADAFRSLFENCQYLIDASRLALPASTLAEECYYEMFYGCKALQYAPLLPATTLAPYCYKYMYFGCSSLIYVPDFPAATLANFCCDNMFYGCTALAIPPELPATTLKNSCYSGMFYGCSSLTYAPELPATTLVSGCYSKMFYGCRKLSHIKAMCTTTKPSSSYTSDWVKNVPAEGVFVKNAAATWTDTFGTSAIPTGWTVETAEA